MYLWFMEAHNSYLVVQSTCTNKYVPMAYKFLWRLQGNMSNYYLTQMYYNSMVMII